MTLRLTFDSDCVDDNEIVIQPIQAQPKRKIPPRFFTFSKEHIAYSQGKRPITKARSASVESASTTTHSSPTDQRVPSAETSPGSGASSPDEDSFKKFTPCKQDESRQQWLQGIAEEMKAAKEAEAAIKAKGAIKAKTLQQETAGAGLQPPRLHRTTTYGRLQHFIHQNSQLATSDTRQTKTVESAGDDKVSARSNQTLVRYRRLPPSAGMAIHNPLKRSAEVEFKSSSTGFSAMDIIPSNRTIVFFQGMRKELMKQTPSTDPQVLTDNWVKSFNS